MRVKEAGTGPTDGPSFSAQAPDRRVGWQVGFMHRLPSVDLLCGAKRAIRLRCVDIGGIREAPSERKRAIQAHF